MAIMPVMINDVPIECINHAAIQYHVPIALILAVMKIENGRNGQAVKNKTGTYDYGVSQINSVWLPKIAAYGYTREDIQYDACRNTEVGVWLISKHLAEGKNIWHSIANYHSKTPAYNQAYQAGIKANYYQLSKVLFA